MMTAIILLTLLPALAALGFILHALTVSTHKTGRHTRRRDAR